jgi:hypothetical protein
MRYFSLLLLLLLASAFQVAFAQDKTPPLFVQLALQNQTNTAYFCEGSDTNLMASSSEDGLLYKWYRDGQLYQTTTAPMLRLREAGIYHVVVSDSTRAATSEKITIQPCPNRQAEIDAIWKQAEADAKPKKPNTPPSTANSFTATVTSVNPVLCNGNSSATLVASPQGTQYSYQWQRADCFNCTYTTQSGLTNTITTTTTVAPPAVKAAFDRIGTYQHHYDHHNGSLAGTGNRKHHDCYFQSDSGSFYSLRYFDRPKRQPQRHCEYFCWPKCRSESEFCGTRAVYFYVFGRNQ